MDEKYIGLLNLDLENLKHKAEEINGRWNGKESGREEDAALWAKEVIVVATKLQDLLNESWDE